MLAMYVFFLMSVSNAVMATTIDYLALLTKHLKQKNPDMLRPVVNQSEPINIYMNFFLTDIIEIDEVRQILKINGAVNISWKDELLHWNESEYGGIKTIVTSDFWAPILSFLRVIGKTNVFEDSVKLARIRSDGVVVWQPSMTLEIMCPMKMTYFPNDKQNCQLQLYPVQYTQEEVLCLKNPEALTYSDFLFNSNNEWNLDNILSVNSSSTVGISEVRSVFSVNILIIREPLFYYQNIIAPIVLLSFLSLFSFWLPDDSGEKISFSLTVLLSLSVFLSTVAQSMPATSQEVVYINLYMTFLLVNSCLICLACIVLLYRHNYLKKQKTISKSQPKNEEVSRENEADRSNTSMWQRFSKGRVHPFQTKADQSRSNRSCCTWDMFLFVCFATGWFLSSAGFIFRLSEKMKPNATDLLSGFAI